MLDRIGSIVFLDAFMPEDSQSGQTASSAFSRQGIAKALEAGAISRPGPPAKDFMVASEEDRAWVDSLTTEQPLGVSLQPIRLTGAREKVAKKTYILAETYDSPNFRPCFEKCKADPAWNTYALPCGHDVMVDMPDRLAEILVEVA